MKTRDALFFRFLLIFIFVLLVLTPICFFIGFRVVRAEYEKTRQLEIKLFEKYFCDKQKPLAFDGQSSLEIMKDLDFVLFLNSEGQEISSFGFLNREEVSPIVLRIVTNSVISSITNMEIHNDLQTVYIRKIAGNDGATNYLVAGFGVDSIIQTGRTLYSGYIILFLAAVIISSGILYLNARSAAKPLEKLSFSIQDFDLDTLKTAPYTIGQIKGYEEVQQAVYLFNTLLTRFSDAIKWHSTDNNDMQLIREEFDELLSIRNKEFSRSAKAMHQFYETLIEELEMARRVQQNLLPSSRDFTERSEFKVGSRYISMEKLGGDLYDIIRVGRNGYGFLIADVSGHGVAAALITTMLKVSFSDNSGWAKDTGEIVGDVNGEMTKLIGDLNYFATAFYGTLNLETAEFCYTNAGHHPVLLYKPATSEVIHLQTPGTIIGVFPEAIFGSACLKLEEGDRLLFFTDGVVESRNFAGELYGVERMIDFIKENSHLTPNIFVDLLINEVDAFTGKLKAEDDRAVLYIEFVSKMQINVPHGNPPIKAAKGIFKKKQ
jgi:serine phosphatase RsbU (regulator of sigma subunit)